MAIEVEERDSVSLVFSTRDLPASKRLGALRDLFDQSIRLEIDAAPGHVVEMKMHLAPGLRRATMLSSFTARLTRPAQMLADGEDTVCLMIKTGGHMALSQGRQEGVPLTGDAVLLVYRQPALLQFADVTYLSVRVPFAALSTLSSKVEDAAARCIPRDTEALTLLGTYIANMPARIRDPQVRRLAAAHVYDLMALAIGATEEAKQMARQRGLRAARLEAIKADVVQSASIDLDRLAARHRISPRYIQMLFQETGTTLSEFALEQRLEAARSMLASPRYAAWSIAAIAFQAGFGDLSNFNRRFKRRYHVTPSDLREQTRLEGPYT